MEIVYLIIGVFIAVAVINKALLHPAFVIVSLLIALLFYFHDLFSTDYFLFALFVLVIVGLIPLTTRLKKSTNSDEELK